MIFRQPTNPPLLPKKGFETYFYYSIIGLFGKQIGLRIVKIENPGEIWIDYPIVQIVEARPQAVGIDSGVKPHEASDDF